MTTLPIAPCWEFLSGGNTIGSKPIAAPKRATGFGMQLIDKGIRHNLGGETKVDFRPVGLYVELTVPLTQTNEPRVARAPAPAA